MIRGIKIRNFKSHLSTQIDLGNLTVLTGVNSAGKSSLVQALLLLRQTYLKDRLREGLALDGDLCKVGNGQAALYSLADSGIVEFCLSDDEVELRFDYKTDGNLKRDFLDSSDFYGRLPNGDEIGIAEIPDRFSLFSDCFQYVSALRWGGRSHFGSFNYEVEKHRQLSVMQGQGEAVAHYLHEYGGEEATVYFEKDDFKERNLTGKEDERTRGESYDETPQLLAQVQNWERQISRDVVIKVKEAEETDKGFDIFYGHKFPGTKPVDGLDAANVGYGLSHVLPVLVALLSAKPGALVILENPEAHLHPRGQAVLAKLISRVAQAGVQVIVETHSDHIVNGILVASKRFEDGKIGVDKDKVRLYYFDKDEATQMYAVAEEVKIVKHGRLDHQPKGFFDQSEEDLFAMNGL